MVCGITTRMILMRTKQFFSLALLASFTFFSACSLFKSDEEKFAELSNKAEAFIEEGKFEEARISLQAAQKIKPNHAETYFKLGEVLVQLKQVGKAVESYRGAIELDADHTDANLHLSTLMLLGNEPEIAESHVRKVLEKEPDNLNAMAVMANVHSKRRNFDRSEEILDKILAKDPEHVGALTGKADAALSRQDFAKSEEFLLAAQKLEPDNNPIKLALVDLYTRQGRGDDAEAVLSGMVEEDPKNSTLRYYLAEFLLTRGSREDSTQHFYQILEDNPDRHLIRDRLFDLLVFEKKPDQAMALAQDLENRIPGDPKIPYFLARNYDLKGDPEQALTNYVKAMEALPHFGPLFRRAGINAMALGKTENAIEYLNKALAINEGDVGARLTLAQNDFRNQDFSAADDHVNRVLARHPKQIGANIIKADLALVDGNLDSAERVYKVLAENFPESGTGYTKLGILEEKRKDFPAAIENYKKAVKVDQAVWIPLRRMASLLVSTKGLENAIPEIAQLADKSKASKAEYAVILGQLKYFEAAKSGTNDFTEARNLLDEAIRLKPEFLPAYSLIAQLDSKEGKLEDAIGRYKQLIELNPEALQFRTLLAMTQERVGDKAAAMQTYRDTLRVSPRFPIAANNLAWLLAEEADKPGNLDEALKLSLMAKEEMPKSASVADTLGWVYFKKGSNRAALQLIEDAIKLEKDQNAERVNPEILFHLASVQNSLGDKVAAKQALSEAIKLAGPSFAERADVKALSASLG